MTFFGKNKLDEMQQQRMLRIESRGVWLAWTALLAAILVQSAQGVPPAQLYGEGAVFVLMCVYSLAASLRSGIWSSTNARPRFASNLAFSALAGAAVTIHRLWANSREDWWQEGYWPGPVIAGICTLLLCLAVLQLCTWIYYRRRRRLDQGEDDPA